MPAPAHTANPAQAPSSPLVVVILLSLLLGIQPVTTDLYLPALPALTSALGASLAQAQLTLSALLLAFGASQLAWGPLSDRFGRRPILLAGLAGYALASVGCALAPHMEALVAWRTLQGAAMGAAVMAGRAIIRDLYTPDIGARVMSKALSGLGVIACASAPLGGALAGWIDWRAAVAVPAVFGAATLALVALRFEESIPQRNPAALQPRVLAATWLQVLRHPTFLAWSALSVASYAGLFTFLAASSFVFIRVLGLTPGQYGLLMFSMSAVYLAGTVLCRRLLPRLGLRRTVAVAGALSLAGGTLMGIPPLLGVQDLWAILLPYYLFILAHGVHQPCSQSGAVGPFPRAAGAASALNGFLMMVAAFGVGHWIAWRMDGTVLVLTQGMWFWGTCIAIVAWTLVRRYGEPGAR